VNLSWRALREKALDGLLVLSLAGLGAAACAVLLYGVQLVLLLVAWVVTLPFPGLSAWVEFDDLVFPSASALPVCARADAIALPVLALLLGFLVLVGHFGAPLVGWLGSGKEGEG